ncbi:MAG: four helix bundle protein, partial [Roseiflexus sp.]
MGQEGFRSLIVWQRSRDLAIKLYRLFPHQHRRSADGLIEQIHRSAVSVPSNIAEGDERQTDREAVRYFYIAKGSLAELRTQLDIAYHSDLLTDDQWAYLDKECEEIGKMLGGPIKARKRY